MGPLYAFLALPEEARIHGQVEPCRSRADHDHAAALRHEDRYREGAFAWMLEYDVDFLAVRELPDCLSELPALAHVIVEARPVHGWQLAPAIKILAIEDALGTHRIYEIELVIIGHYADGMRASYGAKLHPKAANATGSPPNEDILAGLHNVWPVTKKHTVGSRQRQRIASAFFPREMFGAWHALARLHPAKLGKRTVISFVAPDPL